MEKHTAVFLVCLQCCLIMSTTAMPVPESEEMKARIASPSDVIGNHPEKGLSLPAKANAKGNNNADNLMMKYDEKADIDDDADTLRVMSETGTNAGKRTFIQEGKRRLRLVKRRESGNGKNLAEQESHRHSLHKREAERDRRTWSISNALSVLTDMVVEHEQRRLAEEREAMKRRLLELGKRSADSYAARIDKFNQKDQDLVSLLQAALSSSQSN